MSQNKTPRLKNVNKAVPPYELNRFSNDFAMKLGREIVYLLATKGSPSLEGNEWEEIFANCVGASWKPSNVGLDDVVIGNCAWGAKTVKANYPSKQKLIRLISGRNSPVYSFGESKVSKKHRFTWQPHGSQFTILEEVPKDCLVLRIKKPPHLDKDIVLSTIGFDNTWITVLKNIKN